MFRMEWLDLWFLYLITFMDSAFVPYHENFLFYKERGMELPQKWWTGISWLEFGLLSWGNAVYTMLLFVLLLNIFIYLLRTYTSHVNFGPTHVI